MGCARRCLPDMLTSNDIAPVQNAFTRRWRALLSNEVPTATNIENISANLLQSILEGMRDGERDVAVLASTGARRAACGRHIQFQKTILH